jgi:hypothetical protein
MLRLLGTILLAAIAGSPESKMPSDFLRVESKAWNRWLEQPINITWTEAQLGDVLNKGFGPANLAIDIESKLNTRVSFDSVNLTRRETLWRLSKKYEFKVRWTQKKEPEVFLDLAETDEREQSVNGIVITTMTQVMRADYKSYLEMKRTGKITHEKRVGDTIYYSFDVDRDLNFGNGTAAHVPAVQRYKTTTPADKKSAKSKKRELRP